MSVQVRLLSPADAAAYQPVRLRSLQEHPEAFSASYEGEVTRSLDTVAARLETTPDGFMLGAWQGDSLVGIVGLYRSPGIKVRHRAIVGGMYVASAVRGQGIGTALMRTLIEQAKSMAYLEEIILAVTVGNAGARSVYCAVGFTPSHFEKCYLKVGDCYYDLEWMTLRLVDR